MVHHRESTEFTLWKECTEEPLKTPSKTLPRLRRLLVLGVSGDRRELAHLADAGRDTTTRAGIGISRERVGGLEANLVPTVNGTVNEDASGMVLSGVDRGMVVCALQ